MALMVGQYRRKNVSFGVRPLLLTNWSCPIASLAFSFICKTCLCVYWCMGKVSSHGVPGTDILDPFLFTCLCMPVGHHWRFFQKKTMFFYCSTGLPAPITVLVVENSLLWSLSSSFPQQIFTEPIFNVQHCIVVLRSKDTACVLSLLGSQSSGKYRTIPNSSVNRYYMVSVWLKPSRGLCKTSFPLSLNAFSTHLASPELLSFFFPLISRRLYWHFHLCATLSFSALSFFLFKVGCQTEFWSIQKHFFAWSKFNLCVAFYSREKRLIWSIKRP